MKHIYEVVSNGAVVLRKNMQTRVWLGGCAPSVMLKTAVRPTTGPPFRLSDELPANPRSVGLGL